MRWKNDRLKRPNYMWLLVIAGLLHRLYGIMVYDILLEPLLFASQQIGESFAVNEPMVVASADIFANTDKEYADIDTDLLGRFDWKMIMY